jgi:hypothetical protein
MFIFKKKLVFGSDQQNQLSVANRQKKSKIMADNKPLCMQLHFIFQICFHYYSFFVSTTDFV